MGFIPAATALQPSLKMARVSTVAVVVPSPAWWPRGSMVRTCERLESKRMKTKCHAHHIVGFVGDLAYQLRSHVHELVFELD